MTLKQGALLVLLLLAASAAFSDEGELTNESVIMLHNLGLSGDVITLKIRTSQTAFDVSVDGLIQLKKAKVPDEVIAAMLEKDSGVSVARAGSDTRGGARPEESGMYHETADGQLVRVPSEKGQQTTGSGFASSITFGLKKSKL